MHYPRKEVQSVYAMLAENEYGRKNYQNRTGNPFPYCIPYAFHSADKNFSVIDDNTNSVVLIFGDSERLIDAYRREPVGIFTKEKAKILKELQIYSVSLYEWQFRKYTEENALYTLDEETGVIILAKNYYSQEVGIVFDANEEELIV